CGTQNSSGIVSVRAGWNLIAPYEQQVPVSSLTTEPANIISSPFYGYTGAYQTAQSLAPGFGYWVRSTQAGIIHYTDTGTAKSAITLPEINQNWVSLTVTDANANSSTLYFAEQMPANNPFALPPAPPEGVFDLRFTNDTRVEQLHNALQTRLQGAEFPITLSVKNGSLTVQDAINGKLLNASLHEGYPVQVENSAINLINIKAGLVPVAFDMLQNYPNPFNPGTTIRYSLSEKGRVKLRILNQLGEEVAILIDKEENAGMHEFYWDASHLASGVYFMQMQTGSKTLIKKMAFVK
ncbi:MAG: T9SS type A sorting domain-containing protein, partial [Ignavibacteriales bacterium]|nr:T9SS type A sorting domain-containing protein [Ignavibacteriales bacterium]